MAKVEKGGKKVADTLEPCCHGQARGREGTAQVAVSVQRDRGPHTRDAALEAVKAL